MASFISTAGTVVFAPHPPADAATAPVGGTGWIAFTSNRDGDDEIWLMRDDGSGQTQITHNSSADSEPAWSADGNKLAFSSDRDGQREIYVVAIDSGGLPVGAEINISNTPGGDFSPAWSPDGAKIAFSSDRGVATNLRSIYVMNADGTNPVKLSNNNNQGSDFAPAWSPDGSTIAYGVNHEIVGTTFTSALYLIAADGSSQRFLAASSGTTDPAWSPDGSQIAFSAARSGSEDIIALRTDATAEVNLTNNVSSDTLPTWSPDGTKVAYTRGVGGPMEIFSVGVAPGSPAVDLSNHPAIDNEPAWRPSVVPPAFATVDRTVIEADGAALVTVEALSPDTRSRTFAVSLIAGTAQLGIDVGAPAASIELPAGELTVAVAVPIVDDASFELDETFQVLFTETTPPIFDGDPLPTGSAVARVTIESDDAPPTVSVVSASPYGEDAGEISVSIVLSQPIDFPVTFSVVSSDIEATAGEDYTALSTQLVVPAGSSFSGVAHLDIIEDVDTVQFGTVPFDEVHYRPEGRETFSVVATSTDSPVELLGGSVIEIINNDIAGLPRAHIVRQPGDAPGQPMRRTLNEGDATNPTQPLVVELVSERPLVEPVTVFVAAGSVTGVQGVDYTISPSQLVFNPGDGPKTVTLTLLSDNVVEPDHRVEVAFTSSVREVITADADDLAAITLVDDDRTDSVTLSVADESIVEASGGDVVVTRSSTVGPLPVTFTTAEISATPGADYEPLQFGVTFDDGSSELLVPLTVLDDLIDEDDETLGIVVTSPLASTASGTVTIVDDDPSHTVTASSVTVDEAVGDAVVTVALDSPADSPLRLAIDLQAGTASTADFDSSGFPAVLVVPEGSSTAEVRVSIVNDDLFDVTEAFSVRVLDAVGGTELAAATVTITDDDPLPTVSLDSNTPYDESAGVVSLTLLLGHTAGSPLTFDLSSQDVEAVDNEDYHLLTTVVTIPAGFTSAFVRVEIIRNVSGDAERERFVVNAAFDGAGVAGEQVTIIDLNAEPDARFVRQANDPAGDFVRRLVEGTTANATLPLLVTLDPATFESAHDVEIAINSLDDVNAGEPTDFSLAPATVHFEPGDTTHTFTFTAIADSDIEPDAVFIVGLMIDGRLTDQAVITIVDDDTPAGTVGDQLRGGIGDWYDDWFGGASDPSSTNDGFDDGFDWPNIDWPALDLPEVEPPVLPNVDLGDLFDLHELFGGVQAPVFDVNADTLAEIVADFDSVGCPADFVAGGIGGKPVAALGDVIQVRCTRTLAQILEQSGYTGPDLNGASPDILQGLAEQVGLVADIEWSLDAEVVLVAGVDLDGFYVLGESGVRLDVSGSGSAFGSGTVLGVQNTTLDVVASATPSLGARLAKDRTARLRPAALSAATPATLIRTFDGAASMDVTARVDDTTVVWNGDWTSTSGADGATGITTAQMVRLIQDLPGFAVGGVSAPTTIEATGTLTTLPTVGGVTGWALTGSATPVAGLDLGGFTVTDLDLSGFVSPSSSSITVDAGLVIGDGADQIEAHVELLIDGDGFAGSATVTAAELAVGPFRFSDVELVVSVDVSVPGCPECTRTVVLGDGTLVSVSAALTAGSATLVDTAGGTIAAMTGISGSLDADDQVTLTAATFDASVGDVLDVAAVRVSLHTPTGDGPEGDVVLAVDSLTATAPALGDLTVAITGLRVHADGRFSATGATVEQPAGFARSIGLAGLVPVDLTALRLEFTNTDADGAVVDLSEFVVEVDGTVDLSAFDALAFDPVVQIGADVITPASPPAQRAVTFTALVATDPFTVTPIDLGPITLGLDNLTIGSGDTAVVIDAEIHADGFQDGVLLPVVGGSASITGGYDNISGSIDAVLTSAFVDGANGVEVDGSATVGFSAATRGGATVRDLRGTFGVRVGFDAAGVPFVDAELRDVTLGNLTIPFGDFATVQLGDAVLDFTPEQDGIVFSVGGTLADDTTGAGIVFNDDVPALAGWGGRIGGFGVTADNQIVFLDGFFVEFSVPNGEKFGLPDFIPLRVDELGLRLPIDIAEGDVLTDLLGQLQISFSGGLAGTDDFPITATVDNLVIDIGRLIDFDPLAPLDLDTFPIVNLSGVSFMIDPELNLGGAKVSGGITFGTVDIDGTPVLYGRIKGQVSTPAFSAGADIVISEYGPVLLRVTAPLGIPLGPTGLILTSATGAAAFGPVSLPTPRPRHPEDLLTSVLDLPTDATIDAASIAAAIGVAVDDATMTWDQGFAIALEGDLTHVTAAGMMQGHVTLAMLVEFGGGVQLIGTGEVEVFGIPLAEGIEIDGSLAVAGLMIDFTSPLEPQIDVAYQSPTPGSPLAAAFPARTTVVAQLRTTGVVTGVAAGLDAFVDAMAAATLTRLAAQLSNDPGSPLARYVRDTNGDGIVSAVEAAVVISSTVLRERLAALLADSGEWATTIPALIVAVSNEIATMTPSEAAELVADFAAIVGDAGKAALIAAGDRFDPSFTFRGELQPLLLGLPIGSPDTSVEVILDTSSLGFALTTSMIEQLKSQAGLLTGTGQLGEALITAVTLGMRDDLTFGVQVPIPGMRDLVLDGGRFPSLDSNNASQNWSVTVSGQFSQLGMSAQVTGFITSPGNEAFVDARVERRYLSDGTTPPDPNKVQFTRQVDYDNLIRYGGLVLNGRLEVPRLLTDPVDVIADIPPLPEDPLQALAWFEQFGAVVMATETPAQITVFVPGLGEVLDAPTGTARGQAFEDWTNAISFTGVFEGTRQTPTSAPVARLLSIPIGEGRLLATAAGVEVTAKVPLIGLEGTFVLAIDERDLDGVTVPVPTGGLELTLSTALVDQTLHEMGVPDAISFDAAGVDANARLLAYTPGFDPASDDRLRRTGGVAFDATLDVEGLIDNARVDVLVDPIGTGFGPDFEFHAAVDKAGPLAGVTISDANFDVVKLGKNLTIDLGGTADLFGSTWQVDGHLNPDMTGQLVLTGSAGGALPSIGGFQFVNAGSTIELTRKSGVLQASLGLGGTVRLPTWLSGRAGRTTASVSGCMATGGASEFRIALGSVQLDPAGTVQLTGTGAALAIDPSAACTLPPNALGMTNNDVRLVLRTTPAGVTTVAVDGAVRFTNVAAGLPLLSVNGALSSDGTGALTVQFGTNGLDLSGFRLRGGAALTLTGGTNFTLDVNGQMSIPSIVTNATVDGLITNTGIQALTIGVTGLTLPVVTVNSSTLTLNKVAGNYIVTLGATVTVPGVRGGATGSVPTVQINGSLTTAGDFSIAMSGTNFTIVGVPVSGSFELAKTGAAMTVKASASSRYSLWSTQLTVSGSLTVSPSGVSGDATLSLPGGLSFNGFAVGGTLKITFAVGITNTASIALTNGTVTIPGVGTLNATAALNTNGTGHIQVTTPTGIRLGGATSPIFGVGTFRLSLVSSVVTFAATGAGIEYRDTSVSPATVIFSAVVPNFSIASNGSFSVSTNGFTIGSPTGIRLVVPPASVSANASGAALRVNIPAATFFIPGLADNTVGKPALATPAFFVDTTAFRYVLFDAKQINLGLIRLNGKLVFERPAGGSFRLAVESTSAGVPSIDLGELGKVEFPNFFIASDGTFDITASTDRIGTTSPVFEIRDASFRFRRTSTSTTLAINGGDLRLPSLSQPIVLPDLSITLTDTFTRDFTLPALHLGAFFNTTSAQFRLSISRTEATLELREDVTNNNPSVTMFAGSGTITLNDFRVTSNGTFAGSVTGQLALFGDRLGSATMNISLNGGVLRVTIPSTATETINLGFISVNLSGFAQSDGTFSFTGSASTSGSIPVIGPSWNGSASITVANTGISGNFNGNVSFLGLSGSASASVTSTGHASGTLGVDLNGNGNTNGFTTCIGIAPLRVCTFTAERVAFEFDLGPDALSPDTTKPTIGSAPNVSVTTSQATGSIPIYYAQPTASDSRDGALATRCAPGSGSLFAVGQVTTVTCTARDAAGNTQTKTFTVTISVSQPLVIISGSTLTTTLGGFAPTSSTLAAVFSDPVTLDVVTTDAKGAATYTLTIPSDLPPGDHHIVVSGTAPDGSDRLWVVPVTIGTAGQILAVNGADIVPGGTLPATGGSPALPARLALFLVLVGLLAVAVANRRTQAR